VEIKAMKDFISFKPVLVLRNQVWDVAPFGWFVSLQRFEGKYPFHLQG
jgi:hypothetical protein